MIPGKRLSEQEIAEIDDPWIRAYLQFREAVLAGRFTAPREFDDAIEYALALKRELPDQTPSEPAAMFITADIAITFHDEPAPQVLAGLWVPREQRKRT